MFREIVATSWIRNETATRCRPRHECCSGELLAPPGAYAALPSERVRYSGPLQASRQIFISSTLLGFLSLGGVAAAFEYTEDVANLFGRDGELVGFAFAIVCAFGVPALLGALLWRRWQPPSLKLIFLGGLTGAFSLFAFLIVRIFLAVGYIDGVFVFMALGGLVTALIVAGMMVSGAENARRRAARRSSLPQAEAHER